LGVHRGAQMASTGSVRDVEEAQIDRELMEQIMEHLDVDGDGEVTKEEFKVPWMKLFPQLGQADFEKVWKQMDADGNGTLELNELCTYYGFHLSPNARRKGSADMTDEQILEALQLSATLAEMAQEQEERKKAKAAAEAKAAEDAAAEAEAQRRGTRRARRATGSGGLSGGGGGGSDGLRRAQSMGLTGMDREKKKNSSGIMTVKMPTKITQSNEDINIKFMEMCEIGDERSLKDLLKDKDQQVRMEDDKGEMPIHKLARQGCLEATRDILERLMKTESLKMDLNWQDKQGKTPIFYSVEYGHEKLVQLFLDRGSDVMVENHNGWTILHAAVHADRMSVVDLILNHPSVNHDKTLLKKLLNHTDRSWRTALHIASFKSAEGDMVQCLLKYGADPMAKDVSGNTGAALAGKTGRRKSKELLEEHMLAANSA